MGKAKRIRWVSALVPLVFLASCSTAIPKNPAAEEKKQDAAAPAGEATPAPADAAASKPATAPANPSASVSSAAPVRGSEGSATKPLAAENAELQKMVNVLTSRLEAAEARIAALTDNLSPSAKPQAGANARLDPPPALQKPKLAPVPKHPSSNAGLPLDPLPAVDDPEAGFTNDETVQDYRRSMIQFKAGKYPESVLAFSSFLEKFPDHPLAGSAQYFIGQSYFLQKEYKLALQEFQRVLTSYDRSSHLAATLRDMAEAEEKLRLMEDAARHRQLLMSLFPHSPYAFKANAAKTPAGRPANAAPGAKSAGTSSAPAAGATPPTMPLDPVPGVAPREKDTHPAYEPSANKEPLGDR
ncbi:MAG: tetratricopeptide repeat protein [Oligoflexia bacterium]|nr:tetratricopeptide repeat protein [Oligoflexia bacterium]